jgi:hypothetical protein
MKEWVPRLIFKLLLTIFIAGCAGNLLVQPAPGIAREYEVYSAVIEEVYITAEVKFLVVDELTKADVPPGSSLEAEVENIKLRFRSSLGAEILEDYREKNGNPIQLERKLDISKPYALISESERERIFKTGEGWSQFYETYPEAPGMVITLSRVGFNPEGDQALVYVEDLGDFGAGQGLYVFLSKEGDRWIVQEVAVAWVA